MNKKKTTKLMVYPVLITLIGAIVMLCMLLLPFASATDDHAEWLMNYENELYAEEINMTNGEAVNISLFEFGKLYAEMANQEVYKEISIACLVIIGIFAAFATLTLLLAILKKPIGIILCNLLSMGAFKVICYDFEARGIIPSSSYDWGIVSKLVYVIGVIILAGAVWLFIEKRKAKKMAKISSEEM